MGDNVLGVEKLKILSREDLFDSNIQFLPILFRFFSQNKSGTIKVSPPASTPYAITAIPYLLLTYLVP